MVLNASRAGARLHMGTDQHNLAPTPKGSFWRLLAGLVCGAPAGGLCGFLILALFRCLLTAPQVSLVHPAALIGVAAGCALAGGLIGGAVAASLHHVGKHRVLIAALLGGLVGGCGGACFGWVPLGTEGTAGDVAHLLVGLGAVRGAVYGALGGLLGGTVGSAAAGGDYW